MIKTLRFTGGAKTIKKLLSSGILSLILSCFGDVQADNAITYFNTGQYDLAMQMWNQELEKKPGSAELHYNLAVLYARGLGTEPDTSLANQHYLKSAQMGYAPAMFQVGVFMASQNDYQSAQKWWLKASKSDLPEAQYNLALIYSEGLGVEKDLFKAKYWFKKAAQSAMSKYKSLNSALSDSQTLTIR